MTTREVADYIRYNPRTIARWVLEGRVPASEFIKTPGGHIRFRRSALAYLVWLERL